MSQKQIQSLKRRVAEEAEPAARLRWLGTHLGDDTRGGDFDLLLAPTALITGSN